MRTSSFEHEPPLDHDHFLVNRDDGDVPLLAGGLGGLHDAVHRNANDIHVLLGGRQVHDLAPDGRCNVDHDLAGLALLLRDGEFLPGDRDRDSLTGGDLLGRRGAAEFVGADAADKTRLRPAAELRRTRPLAPRRR